MMESQLQKDLKAAGATDLFSHGSDQPGELISFQAADGFRYDVHLDTDGQTAGLLQLEREDKEATVLLSGKPLAVVLQAVAALKPAQ